MKKSKYIFLVVLSIILSSCDGSTASSGDGSFSGTSSYSDRAFPADNPWNQDISNEPLDPNSDTYITSLGKSGTVHPDFGTWWEGAPLGQPVNVVTSTQSKVPVTFSYVRESDPGPYPIPADAEIQGGPEGTGDRHLIVIDKDNGILYEMYQAFQNSDGSWRADSGAKFNLNTNELRPAGYTSADAAGLPIYPGLVRYEEVVVKKEINHALRFTANRTRHAYVYPARHAAGISTDSSLPPMGMRVRLKASFDISPYPESVQIILRALKKYGMILADNGTSWMLSGIPDDNWSDSELHTIKQVPGSAFEVVKMGEVQY
ncbi:MAG: hypothetical protein H7177_07025 [Rhizobacter sp.]|nr:hypothetical protein [Bacteriovorax sp.]